ATLMKEQVQSAIADIRAAAKAQITAEVAAMKDEVAKTTAALKTSVEAQLAELPAQVTKAVSKQADFAPVKDPVDDPTPKAPEQPALLESAKGEDESDESESDE
ncbi:MAG: hypothetical protein VB878_15510, partial [Pirellulaceae bacterium]